MRRCARGSTTSQIKAILDRREKMRAEIKPASEDSGAVQQAAPWTGESGR